MELDKLTERINYLYNKSKSEGLTEEEAKEQEALRKQYVDRVKNNLRAQLKGINRKGKN